MYDRIKMFQQGQFNNVEQNLDNVSDIVDKETGEVIGYKGKVENLNISIFNSGLSITGSLSKFMYNDNLFSLNQKTTKEAIYKLSDSLKINIDEAKISELEFGTNFIMKYPIKMYLDLLKNAPYLEAIRTTNDTLYFRSKGKTRGVRGKNNKVLCFYDKKKEVENRKGLIPDAFVNKNVLRYEIRYNGRLARQFKTEEVTANLLYSDKLYNKIKQDYCNNYNLIAKVNCFINESKDIKTVSDAYKSYIASNINITNSVDNYISCLKEQETFRYPKDYTRLKKKLNNLSTMAVNELDHNLSKELDNEIKQL